MIPTNFKPPLRLMIFTIIITVFFVTGLYKLYKLGSFEEPVKAFETNAINNLSEKDNDIFENKTITGTDLISIYDEIKESDFAVLVATKAFLIKEKDELIDSNEYPYIRYILSKNNESIAESIRIDNEIVSLTFINYNTVLADNCLYQETDGIYKVVLGFINDNNNEGPNMIRDLPITTKASSDIYTVYEDSLFIAKLIHNEEGTLIGYAFIEQ